jgi:transcriptional regulator with XRE-family HTH domain
MSKTDSRLINEINSLLEAKGIGQTELGAEVGIPQSQLSRYLTGKTTMPIDKYERVMDFLAKDRTAELLFQLEKMEAVKLVLSAEKGTLDQVLRLLRRGLLPDGQKDHSSAG